MADRLKNELLDFLSNLEKVPAKEQEEINDVKSLLKSDDCEILDEKTPVNPEKLKQAENEVCLFLDKMTDQMQEVIAKNREKLSLFHFSPETNSEPEKSEKPSHKPTSSFGS